MQKKMIGILAGVASVHAVVLTGLLASGGCTHTEILAPHAYVNGPEIAANVPAAEQPAPTAVNAPEAPAIPGAEPVIEPIAPAPAPIAAPEPAPVKPDLAQGGVYTVQKGDTLSAIAHKHGMRTNDLAAYNNLTGKAANKLKVGQKLNIPAGGTYTAPKSAKPVVAKSPKAAKSAKPAVKAERPADGIYVVKKGDTLDRIARRYGTTGRAIAEENNIDIGKTLHIGDKLRLPAAGAAATKSAASAAAATTLPAEPAKLDANVGDDLTPELTPVTAPAQPADVVVAPDASAAPAQPAAADAVPAENMPTVNTDALEVPRNMTLSEFSKSSGVDEATLRRLNPQIAADGQLSAGSFLVIPQPKL